MIIVFLKLLGLGLKFFRWGEKSIGRIKLHQVGTSVTVKCVGLITIIKLLRICILGTLLNVNLKRRAEISADIFACLLQYSHLSCKNLTINV